MRFLYLPLLLLLSLGQVKASAQNIANFSEHFKLVPQPQKIELLPGNSIPYTLLKGIYLNGPAQKPVLPGLLANLPLSATTGKGRLVLAISDNNALPTSPEGYILQVENDQVTISARGQAGLF